MISKVKKKKSQLSFLKKCIFFIYIINVNVILCIFTISIMFYVIIPEIREFFLIWAWKTAQHLPVPECHILFIYHVQ